MARITVGSERGDAGLPILLIVPALLLIVLHLVNASQQLYERREAFAVAAAAVRFGNQADPENVRLGRSAAIDTAQASTSIQNFVVDQGYDLVDLAFTDVRGDGTLTIAVTVERRVEYIFPNAFLSETVDGNASAVLNRGVSAPGS